MSNLNVKTYKRLINEIDPEVWDRIAAGRGFQSHQWYQFGERAMADSPATYLIAWDGDSPAAAPRERPMATRLRDWTRRSPEGERPAMIPR